QTQKDRVGAQPRAEAAVAELVFRLPAQLEGTRTADVRGQAFLFAATLEDSQHVAGLLDFPPVERHQVRQDAFSPDLIDRRRRPGHDALNLPVLAVTFAEVRVLHRPRAVVVEGRPPQHPAVSHHALLRPYHFALVAFAACRVRGAEVARVDEADVFVALFVPGGRDARGVFAILFFW